MSKSDEFTVVVAPDPPPARQSRLLARALRVAEAGPVRVYRAGVVSLAATCILGITIAVALRPGRLPEPQRELIFGCLAGLLTVGVLVLLSVGWPARRRTALLDRFVAPDQRAAIWLAAAVWFPLLLLIAYYRAKATLPPAQRWIAFGYLDKRWLTAAYLLAALAPMPLVLAAGRVLEAGRAHPPTWRAWLRDLGPQRQAEAGTAAGAPAGRRRTATASAVTPVMHTGASPQLRGPRSAALRSSGAGAIRGVLGILTALALAWYFYGPPWYLNRPYHAAGVGDQESLFLQGFQAISKGAVPYVGPASVQYGPGAQLLSYWYMRHVATFSVVGFRESWAMFQWAGASVFFVVLFLALGYLRGLAAALLSALVYPALELMGFVPGYSYAGFFGWADPLRYAGMFALILLLPAVIRRCPGWRGLTGGVALGLVWGSLCYIAQENLLGGLVGALVLGAVLLFSGTSSWRQVLSGLAAVLAGFLAVWLPVLGFYASKGLLGTFVHLYFLITRAVAEGYSNTPYGGAKPTARQLANNEPWAHMFYFLPLILAALALLSAVQFRPFRIAVAWSRDRVMLASVVLLTILMYQGALLRSDFDHLAGTLLIVPALVVTVASILPRLLGLRRRWLLVVTGAALVAGSFGLLPSHAYTPSHVSGWAMAPLRDRERLDAAPAAPAPANIAAQRIGTGLWAAPSCCQYHSEPMSQFLKLASQLHAVIGARTTYVAGFPAGYPGIIYFAADLTPAPFPVDLNTMVFTAEQLHAYEQTFGSQVLPRTQAMVTGSFRTPEAAAFLRLYPQARRISLSYQGRPYWVLLRPGPAPGGR